MGIYIEGMEIPKSCETCFAYERCNRQKYKWGIDKPVGCPLVSVPPHGRLIDADEIVRYKERLVVDADKINPAIRYVVDTKYIDEAPTIIPAEEGE